MVVTEYEVGLGAYGVAIAADGAVWTSLIERGELARVDPGGQVSRVRLDSAHSRPMVLALGPDDAVSVQPRRHPSPLSRNVSGVPVRLT